VNTSLERSSQRAERLLVPAAFITTVGNAFQITAAAILVFRAEETALAVGWLFVLAATPQVVLSLVAGQLADRFDRRRLCMIADLCSAVVAMILPLWLWLGGGADAGSYTSIFLLACMATLFGPASSALIKERIRDERIGPFNARFEMANNAGMLLAAAAAGFLVVFLGPIPLCIANACTFVASAAFVFGLGPRPRRIAAAVDETGDEAEAARTAAGAAPVRTAIPLLAVLYSAGNAILVVTNVLLTVVILGAFHASAGYVGLVDALVGGGFLIGAAVYRFTSPRIQGLWLAMLGYLGSCVMLVLQPLSLWLLMIVIPISGFCFAQGRIAARTLLMQASPEQRAGRIFGATQAFGLAYAIAATVGLSALSDATHVRYAFWGLALLVATTVLLAGGALIRRVVVKPAPAAPLAGVPA
jgi:MFS family permease